MKLSVHLGLWRLPDIASVSGPPEYHCRGMWKLGLRDALQFPAMCIVVTPPRHFSTRPEAQPSHVLVEYLGKRTLYLPI